MDVMDVRDGAAAWEALASRDSCSRDAAMEHIEQEVKRKVESIGPIMKSSSSSTSSSLSPRTAEDLNCVLARVLMLSKRCPYTDVRERCIWLLRSVQVRNMRWTERRWETGMKKMKKYWWVWRHREGTRQIERKLANKNEIRRKRKVISWRYTLLCHSLRVQCPWS